MISTMRQHGMEIDFDLLEALVEDGMFPVEHLIVENDTLHGVIAEHDNPGLGWPR